MTRQEKINAMREIVRDMGEKVESENMTMWSIMLLNITLYEDDVYTDVCIQPDGDDDKALTIGGYDGESQGWCENVNESDDQTIDRVYAAMLEWAGSREDSEHYMTRDAARRYMDEVLEIVEKEMDGFGSIRTYQERHGGHVWGEGLTVDCNMEEGNGTYIETRSICYHVRSQEGKVAYIRRTSTNERGYGDDLPFMGDAKAAADYLLEPYRAYFHTDDEEWDDDED